MARFRFSHSSPVVGHTMGRPGEWFVTVEGRAVGKALNRIDAETAADWFEEAWPYLAQVLAKAFDPSPEDE